MQRDPFHFKEDEKEILKLEVPYLSVIGALLYLAQCTKPNIFFVVNLLTRYCNESTTDTGHRLKKFSATSRVRKIWD